MAGSWLRTSCDRPGIVLSQQGDIGGRILAQNGI